MSKFFDVSLGIQPQARAVLQMLDGQGLDTDSGFECATWAWYNGRERGFAMTCGAPNVPTLVVVCNELSNGDSIVVDQWYTPRPWMVQPETADFAEGYYGARKFFPCGNVGAAADYLMKLVEQHQSAKARKAAFKRWKDSCIKSQRARRV